MTGVKRRAGRGPWRTPGEDVDAEQGKRAVHGGQDALEDVVWSVERQARPTPIEEQIVGAAGTLLIRTGLQSVRPLNLRRWPADAGKAGATRMGFILYNVYPIL